MFARIAGRYDLLNRLMTLGQDRLWRREAVSRLVVEDGATFLDVGAGTGDFAMEILRVAPGAFVVAVDFTLEMMQVGRRRRGSERVHWVQADALKLPFASGVFDGAVSGFLLRNVEDLDGSLAEQRRVLRNPEGENPRGRIVSLETTPPRGGVLRPLLQLHLHYVIPLLGRLVARDEDAYRYLPDSTQDFLTAEVLESHLTAAGFQSTGFSRRMLGTVAIHWGEKGD